jgi:CrcB protein
MLFKIMLVMAGGSLGAAGRFLMVSWIHAMLGYKFPYGILSCNVIGSFLMGFLSVLLITKLSFNDTLKALLLTGFLGSFTTFSSFSMDTLNLFYHGENIKGLLYIALSFSISMLAVFLGLIAAKTF